MGNGLSKKVVFHIGLGVATTAVLGYIWFGPKPDPHPGRVIWEPTVIAIKPKGILGLYNFGNSCYLNSLLQALAGCRHYVIYINKYYELKQLCSKADENDPSFRIVSALSTANRYINREAWGDDAEMSREIPKGVLAIFKTLSHASMATHMEQDTHETFNIIQTAMLEEQIPLRERLGYLEAVKIIEDDSYSLLGSDHTEFESIWSARSDEDHSGEWSVNGIAEILSETPTGTHIVTRGSLTEVPCCPSSPTGFGDWNNPFVGRLASVLKCIQCMVTIPVKFEEFNDLSLTLPLGPERMLTLQDLIGHYFRSTFVHQVDCPSCSAAAGVPTKSTFHKKTCVTKFPRSLCFHINRATWGQTGSNKRFDFIPFGLNLDMGIVAGLSELFNSELPVVDGTGTGDTNNGIVSHRQNTKYELSSVICHRGNVRSGHFVTYRRGPRHNGSNNEWYMVSDTWVRIVPEDQVLVQHAYMLFYDRIDIESAESTLIPEINVEAS